jgi:hypothetical protein
VITVVSVTKIGVGFEGAVIRFRERMCRGKRRESALIVLMVVRFQIARTNACFCL